MPPDQEEFDKLLKRVDQLEKAKVPIGKLPLVELRRALGKEPQAAGDLLLPHSVTGEQLKGTTPWQPLPLSANWKAYESAAFSKPEFKRSVDGLVRLRGLVQPNAIGQLVVATLPEGYHPAVKGTQGGEAGFACPCSFTPGATVQRFDVRSNGEIWPEVSFAGTTTAFYLFLDPISFYVE